MKKTLIAFTVAGIMVVPGLTAPLRAAENVAQRGATEAGQTVVLMGAADEKKTAEEELKAEEVRKTEEAKKLAEAKKAVEEANKVIVARVNGSVINMFMLTRAMNRVAPKYVREGDGTTPEIATKIKSEALDMLIIEELAVHEAIKHGINPPGEAIDKVVAKVRENLGSEQAYRGYLDKNNLTEDVLRKLIERSQRLELITAKEVYGKIKVEEKLLRGEYEKEKAKYILPENFVATDVWFVKGKDEAARRKAVEILKIIRSKGNDPGKTTSDGTFLVRKLTVKKERYPEIYKAMADMEVGDLNGLIDEKDGFHVIKIIKKDPSRPATFEEARPTIESKFLYPAQEQRRHQWEKELRENAKIEILVDDLKKDMAKQGDK